MPGPAFAKVDPVPKFVPVPPVPVHQVTVAPAPKVPLAVKVCVALEQIDAAGAVTLVMAGAAVALTVIVASAAGVHVPVTRA